MFVKGICPKCGKDMKLSRHHIVPRRFDKKSSRLFLICRKCHWDLEDDIPQNQELTELEYYRIIIRFLNRGKRYGKGGKRR